MQVNIFYKFSFGKGSEQGGSKVLASGVGRPGFCNVDSNQPASSQLPINLHLRRLGQAFYRSYVSSNSSSYFPRISSLAFMFSLSFKKGHNKFNFFYSIIKHLRGRHTVYAIGRNLLFTYFILQLIFFFFKRNSGLVLF